MKAVFLAWKKEDQDAQIIQAQKYFILILLLLSLLFFTGWITAPRRLTVYVPPDISNGATLKVNDIPKPLIYSFAYEIWQRVNTWTQEGNTDYPANLRAYWSYLSPRFSAELLAESQSLKEAGQLQRQRFLQGVSGSAYEPANVKRLSADTWEVNLKMRLLEYKNGQIVKDAEILYPLKITRINISQQENPYCLALAGFVSPPARLKTAV